MSSSSPATDDGAATVELARAHVERRLAAAGIDTAAAEALWLVQAVTGLAPAAQALDRGRRLERDERERLAALLRRREAREPLAYVVGGTEFYGLPLVVERGVLVPRPETERLVELALADVPGDGAPVVLDVGTGSGAVALAVEAARPGARVVALDVSRDALAVAARNVRAHGSRVELIESDLLGAAEARSVAAVADVVIANLPYLPRRDRDAAPPELAYEPPLALYAGDDGLAAARAFLAEACRVLRRDAVVWLELDPRTVDALAREAADAHWREPRVLCDLNLRRRFLRIRPPVDHGACADRPPR